MVVMGGEEEEGADEDYDQDEDEEHGDENDPNARGVQARQIRNLPNSNDDNFFDDAKRGSDENADSRRNGFPDSERALKLPNVGVPGIRYIKIMLC